jgi:DNA polymerase I-like protein with 3'-5' exonuclease and polymerase domains
MVQGGVAEFMKNTMIELDKSWARDMLILQVHDEFAFDAPIGEGMTEKLHALLTEIAHSVPHFKYPMKWAPKKWSLEEAA